jgi:ABC-type Fe3+ transport system substrate-binding protein
MSDPQGVQIDPQQVANATAQLDATAAALSSAWQTRMAAIAALNNPSTWGTDDAGKQFAQQYAEAGGTDMQGKGNAVVADVVAFGPDVRTAVENSLAADQEQARLVDVPVEGL